MQRIIVLFCVLGSLTSSVAGAQDLTESVAPNARSGRDLGVYFGVNDPLPAIAGFNASLHVFDFMRITAGIGKFTQDIDVGGGMLVEMKSIAYAVGTRFVVPNWKLSPVAGISVGSIKTEDVPDETRHVYFTAGLEWQTSFGANIGAGFSQSTNSEVGGMPYATLGWYFDAL